MQFLLHTYAEAGEMLRVSESTVRRLVDTGDLPSVRFRGLVRVRDTDLREYVAKGCRKREVVETGYTKGLARRIGGAVSQIEAVSALENLLGVKRSGTLKTH